MTKPQDWNLILTGAYTGKTVELNNSQFVDGVLGMHGTQEAVQGLIKYMGRSYQAYLEGSDELAEAQERDRLYAIEQADKRVEEAEAAELEALRTAREMDDREELAAELRELRALQAEKDGTDGQRDIHGEVRPEEGVDPSEGEVQPSGERTTETSAVDGERSDEAAKGAEGSVPSRDGHENSGIPDAETGSRGNKSTEGSVEIDTQLVKAVHALDPGNDEHWTGTGLPAMTAIEVAYGSTGVTRKDVNAAVPDWDREKAQETEDLKELTE